MKTDRYLKVVLTVIAVSLVLLVIQNSNTNIVTEANASENRVSGVSPTTIDVNIVSVGGRHVGYDGLDVKVTNAPDVSIKNTPNVKFEIPYSGLDVNVRNYRDFK